MKRYRVRLIPDDGKFHPFDRLVMAAPDLERVAIHNIHLIDDGAAQMLYEFCGSRPRLEGIMESLDCEARYQITEVEGRIFLYLLFEPNETIRRLVLVHHNHKICLDPPQIFTTRGDLLLTYYGTDRHFHEAMAEVPDDVGVKLERKSEFEPSVDPFLSKLTMKQREIMQTAVDLGYYQLPREATLEGIGDELNLSAATVGEHLQKVEKKLVTMVAADSPARAEPPVAP